MRRVLSLFVLAAGCAGPDGLRTDPTLLPTADVRERDLRRNLRGGLSWDEQERRIADAKAAFARSPDDDASGPARAK